MAITTPKLAFEEYLKYDDRTDTRFEEEFRSQNGLNAPLPLTGAEPETFPLLRSE